MPLSNYTELQAAVGTWSFNRTDLPAADLIALGEARLNRDLRLRAMEADTALAAAAGERTIALPAGFLAPIALWRERAAGREALRRVTGPIPVSAAAGRPDYWTVEGAAIGFERPCDQACGFTLRALLRFALSEAEPTNWLLSNHPDAYLAAALVEAALWAADEEQAVRWQARYQAAVDAINNRETRSRAAALAADLPVAASFDIQKG
jgi:hypothetical protein